MSLAIHRGMGTYRGHSKDACPDSQPNPRGQRQRDSFRRSSPKGVVKYVLDAPVSFSPGFGSRSSTAAQDPHLLLQAWGAAGAMTRSVGRLPVPVLSDHG